MSRSTRALQRQVADPLDERITRAHTDYQRQQRRHTIHRTVLNLLCDAERRWGNQRSDWPPQAHLVLRHQTRSRSIPVHSLSPWCLEQQLPAGHWSRVSLNYARDRYEYPLAQHE